MTWDELPPPRLYEAANLGTLLLNTAWAIRVITALPWPAAARISLAIFSFFALSYFHERVLSGVVNTAVEHLFRSWYRHVTPGPPRS